MSGDERGLNTSGLPVVSIVDSIHDENVRHAGDYTYREDEHLGYFFSCVYFLYSWFRTGTFAVVYKGYGKGRTVAIKGFLYPFTQLVFNFFLTQ